MHQPLKKPKRAQYRSNFVFQQDFIGDLKEYKNLSGIYQREVPFRLQWRCKDLQRRRVRERKRRRPMSFELCGKRFGS